MKHGIRLVLLGALCGCSASQPPVVATATPGPATIHTGSGIDVNLSAEARTVEETVFAPVAEAWPALLAAWEALDIPIDQQDARGYALRSRAYRMPRQMGGKRRSELLDCGTTMTGQRADAWDVTLEIMTGLRQENPARTRVSTVVIAAARPREGTSNSPVSCQSKGELEKIIIRQLAEHTE
jgi:hypothetical protein